MALTLPIRPAASGPIFERSPTPDESLTFVDLEPAVDGQYTQTITREECEWEWLVMEPEKAPNAGEVIANPPNEDDWKRGCRDYELDKNWQNALRGSILFEGLHRQWSNAATTLEQKLVALARLQDVALFFDARDLKVWEFNMILVAAFEVGRLVFKLSASEFQVS